MKNFLISFKDFLLNLLFPRFCLNCQKEGNYLCSDCQGLFDISESYFCLCQTPQQMDRAGKCRHCQSKNLHGLYFALSYDNFLVKKLIQQFKYPPYVKDLSKTLVSLIITHFQLLNNSPDFSKAILVPVPLSQKKLKLRGFNQAKALAKELSSFLKTPMGRNILLKTKETLPQVELSEEKRKENVKGVFLIKNKKELIGKKILLVDDVYTTGSTMKECARVLKRAGAKEVWGVVVARG